MCVREGGVGPTLVSYLRGAGAAEAGEVGISAAVVEVEPSRWQEGQ